MESIFHIHKRLDELMRIKIFALLLATFTLIFSSSLNAQDIDALNGPENQSDDNISEILEQIVTEQQETQAHEALNDLKQEYDKLKKEFQDLKESNDNKDKDFNLYIDDFEKRLSIQKIHYDQQLAEYESKVEAINAESKTLVRDKVKDVKETFNFFLIMTLVIFALIILVVIMIGVFFYLYGKTSTEKAIQKAIETQTGVEIKRFLAEINLEERLQDKGDHAINRLFTDLGEKSRVTIKKLDHIQSEYETTLDSLKDRFKETSAVAIRQQFSEIELKSKDKIKSLNDVQGEYEKTLTALKSKVKEISEHLTEKGHLDLQYLLEELENKSGDKISKLDNIQGEYENTLGSLKSKIIEVEEKISKEGSTTIQALIDDLNTKSLVIVDKLVEIQSEYEQTLSSLEEKIRETEEQMTIKGDTAIKEFLSELELESGKKIQEFDEIKGEKMQKLDELHSEYETSLSSLNDKVDEVASEVSEKGNEVVQQLFTELEKSSQKVKELDVIQTQYDQTLVDLKEKLKDVEEEVSKESDEAIKGIFSDLELKSDNKVEELDKIKTEYENTLKSLKERFKQAEETFADKDIESMNALFEELMINSEQQIGQLQQIKQEYEAGLEGLGDKISETEQLLHEKGEVAIDKLFQNIEQKSGPKIDRLDDIHTEFEDTLDLLKERVKDTEIRIEQKNDEALVKLSQKLEDRSSEEIFKLNKLQDEYLNALNFLNEKIECREEMQVRHDALPNELDGEVIKLLKVSRELVKDGVFKDALNELNKALALSPSSIEGLQLRAQVNKEQELDSLAIEDLAKIIKIDSDNLFAYSQRAELHKKLHDNNNALNDLNEIVRIDSENAAHYSERGVIYGRLNLDEEAIKDFTRSIELNPEASGPYFFRALIYKKQGDSSRALADFSATIERDPNEAYLYKNRAQIHSRSSHYSEAIADYIKAIKLDGSDFSNCVNLTKTYLLSNNFVMAKDNLHKHMRNAPKVQDKIMCAFYDTILSELTDKSSQKAIKTFTEYIEKSGVTMRCFLDDIITWNDKSAELSLDSQSFIAERIEQLRSIR